MIPTPPPAYLRHDCSKRTTSTSLLSDLPILCSSGPETEQELALPMDSKDILDLEFDSATPSSLVGVSLKENLLLHSNLVQGCSSPISESQGQWALFDHEKEVYDRLFASWDKSNTGLFQGLFANELFGTTGLTTEELAKIWALADVGNRGALDKLEFRVALGLLHRRLQGVAIPDELPEILSQGLSSATSVHLDPQSPPSEPVDLGGNNQSATQKIPWHIVDEYPRAPETGGPTSAFQTEMEKTEVELAKLDQEILALTEALCLEPSGPALPSTAFRCHSMPPPPQSLLTSPSLPSVPAIPPQQDSPNLPESPGNKPLPPLPLSGTCIVLPLAETSRGLEKELRLLEDKVADLSDRLAEVSTPTSESVCAAVDDDDDGDEYPRQNKDAQRQALKEELISLVVDKIPELKKRIKAQGKAKVEITTEDLLLRPPPLSPAVCSVPLPPPPPLATSLSRSSKATTASASSKTHRRRPPPPPPSRPPSVAVTNLIQAIRAGKQLKPTKTVVKRGNLPTGKVLEGSGANCDVTTVAKADLGDEADEPILPGSYPSHPPTSSSQPPIRGRKLFFPHVAKRSDLLREIEVGKVLQPVVTVERSTGFKLGKVLENNGQQNSHSPPASDFDCDLKVNDQMRRRPPLTYSYPPLRLEPTSHSRPLESPQETSTEEWEPLYLSSAVTPSPTSKLLKEIQVGKDLQSATPVVKRASSMPLGKVLPDEDGDAGILSRIANDHLVYGTEEVIRLQMSLSCPPVPLPSNHAAESVSSVSEQSAPTIKEDNDGVFLLDSPGSAQSQGSAGPHLRGLLEDADSGDEDEYVLV